MDPTEWVPEKSSLGFPRLLEDEDTESIILCKLYACLGGARFTIITVGALCSLGSSKVRKIGWFLHARSTEAQLAESLEGVWDRPASFWDATAFGGRDWREKNSSALFSEDAVDSLDRLLDSATEIWEAEAAELLEYSLVESINAECLEVFLERFEEAEIVESIERLFVKTGDMKWTDEPLSEASAVVLKSQEAAGETIISQSDIRSCDDRVKG